jgi:hypothetical protein
MATLTSEYLEYLRKLTGVQCTQHDISDALVQTLYDRATDLDTDYDTETTEAITVIYILRALLGINRTQVDQTGDFGNQRSSQFFEHILKMLKEWYGIAGLGGYNAPGMGRISVGRINTDLDWTEADTDAEWLGL